MGFWSKHGHASLARLVRGLPAVLPMGLLPLACAGQAPAPAPASDPYAYASIRTRAAHLVQAPSVALPCQGGTGSLRVFDTPPREGYKRGIQYVWVQLPRACASFQVAMVETRDDMAQLFQRHGADAAIVASGGFRSRQAPLAEGLHISQSVRHRPRAQWTTRGRPVGGFVAQTATGVQVLPASTSDRRLTELSHVLQAKPVLLLSGQVAIDRDDFVRGNRVVILVGRGGEVGVMGVFGPVSSGFSLYETALLAKHVAELTRLEAPDAINLEGGPGAHVYLPGLKKNFGVFGEREIASVSLLGRRP